MTANCSLRSVSKSLQLVFSQFNLELDAPHWTTIRLWLLRFGLAQLQIPLASEDDWIWIMDCSVQIGSQRVLVILGIRSSDIAWGRSLSYQDVELVALEVLHQGKKEDFHRCMLERLQNVTVPKAILSDHGADLLGGIRLLQESHPKIIDLYDVKHKAACILKAQLENDEIWHKFQTHLGQSKFKTQQTLFAYATAPSQRSKAKYMNLQKVVRWGRRILWHLEQQKANQLSNKTKPSDKGQKFLELFGWVQEYDKSIEKWSQWLSIIEITLDLARREGLHCHSRSCLEEKLMPYDCSDPVASKLLQFIDSQSALLGFGERLPHVTEVIESLFSKLKNAERTQEKSGFTSMILTIGAMVGKQTTERLREAFLTTPTKAVLEWARKSIGTTVQAARSAFYRSTGERNENRKL